MNVKEPAVTAKYTPRIRFLWRLFSVLTALILYILVQNNPEMSLGAFAGPLNLFYGSEFEFTQGAYISGNGLIALTSDCSGAKLFCAMFLTAQLGFVPENILASRLLSVFIRRLLKISLLAYFITFLRISLSLYLIFSENPALAHNILSLAIYFISVFGLYTYMNFKSKAILPEVSDEN